jgi:phosphoesterase RecJ-like protein
MTDTGCFSYSASNPNTYRVMSELLNYNIDKDRIFSKVYENFSENRMRFMGFVTLERMVVIKELKTAYVYITAADRERFSEKFADTENFVNIPLSIKGIYFTAFFIERDNFIKISFRSRGSFPVNEFGKKHFNGGGHPNAAGGESYLSLEDTIKSFENIINTEYKDILTEYEY